MYTPGDRGLISLLLRFLYQTVCLELAWRVILLEPRGVLMTRAIDLFGQLRCEGAGAKTVGRVAGLANLWDPV